MMLSSLDLPHKIPILDKTKSEVGYLKRLSTLDDVSKELLTLMTDWRNQFGSFFMTQFHATPERTEKWLKELIISDPTRAMYLIENIEGECFGHVGVKNLNTNCPELDNMIRGRSGIHPQVMRLAEAALLSVIFESGSADAVCLDVFSRNWIPIGIHQSFGFKVTKSVPLFRKSEDNEVRFVPYAEAGEEAEVKYLTMEISREDFQRTMASFYN